MAEALRKTRLLIPGERLDVENFQIARRWLTIYEHRQAMLAFDSEADPEHIAAIAEGVSFWSTRVAELSGLELDSDRRLLNPDSDREVSLTRRELQLLEFLVQHPERYFADHVLALRAWGERLSGDQVRIYVRRLRQKLAGTSWQLVSRRGQGYALERRPAGAAVPARRSQPTEESVARAIGRVRVLLAHQQRVLGVTAAAAERLKQTLDAYPG